MSRELMELNKVMRTCPATGWAGFQTYLLHLVNGSIVNGAHQYYFGECEKTCDTDPILNGQIYNYPHYFSCIFKHYRRFGIGEHWHIEFGKKIWYLFPIILMK